MKRLETLCDDIGNQIITHTLNEMVTFKKKKYPSAVLGQLIESGRQILKNGRTSTSLADCKEIFKAYGFNVSDSSTVAGWDITL